MNRDITFGQYYPADSFIHKLDPRIKLLISIVFIVAIFLCEYYWAFLVCFLFLTIAVIVSKIPVRNIFKSIKAIIIILLVTVIINVLFSGRENPFFKWGFVSISWDGIQFAFFMAMRLIFLVLATSLVTLTTTPMTLTDGLESLISPLKLIKFPVHDVAIIMSIALRFIPTLMEEIDKIIMAQKARGAAFDEGNLLKKIKALIPILVPLFVSTFRIADELALALDARCYNATDARTKMKELKLSWRDFVASLFTLGMLAVVVLLKLGVIL
ncbi:MAG: energy-coupling factor transporter transmembrane component T [Clostridia bacterium]